MLAEQWRQVAIAGGTWRGMAAGGGRLSVRVCLRVGLGALVGFSRLGVSLFGR